LEGRRTDGDEGHAPISLDEQFGGSPLSLPGPKEEPIFFGGHLQGKRFDERTDGRRVR